MVAIVTISIVHLLGSCYILLPVVFVGGVEVVKTGGVEVVKTAGSVTLTWPT